MSHVQRTLIALVLVAGVAGHASQVNADAIADQKKVYKVMGVNMQVDEKCTIFTKSDAERVFHAPVVHIDSEVDKNACAYGLAKDPSVGVDVSRAKPPLDPPTAGTFFGAKTSQVRHVKGVGQDAYTSYINAGYGGTYFADVLTSKGVTHVILAEKAGNADTALAIARIVMNR
jgi:hypothetical protein